MRLTKYIKPFLYFFLSLVLSLGFVITCFANDFSSQELLKQCANRMTTQNLQYHAFGIGADQNHSIQVVTNKNLLIHDKQASITLAYMNIKDSNLLEPTTNPFSSGDAHNLQTQTWTLSSSPVDLKLKSIAIFSGYVTLNDEPYCIPYIKTNHNNILYLEKDLVDNTNLPKISQSKSFPHAYFLTPIF